MATTPTPIHELRLFVGGRSVLRQFREITDKLRLFDPGGATGLAVMPLDDDLHDELRRTYGTGDWLEQGPRLSSGDIAYCAKLSRAGPLAYIEAIADKGGFSQAAMAWRDGRVSVRPQFFAATSINSPIRARALWPMNVALHDIGAHPGPHQDALEVTGIARFASNADIIARAEPIP